MTIDIHFDESEKHKFLSSCGFTIKKMIVGMGYPCYHNDMEHEDVEVYAVFLNGKEYHRPCGYNFAHDKWVDSVFESELSKKIKKMVL
jgi:hypothetical protein